MLGSERIHEHFLTHLLNEISAHLVDDRHILKAIALGDVAAPDRLVDSVGVDALNNVAEESLEDARVNLDIGILVLSL